MPTSSKPKTVLETILEWSLNRPAWQRDALRRIIADGTPDEEDLSEILALCKKEHGDETVSVSPVPLDEIHLPVDPGSGESVTLSQLGDVVGVNQLASDQILKFESAGITVIYGPNGTGKSGYSRILKKACRSRHAGDIMPDVYSPSPTGNATATMVASSGSNPVVEVDWEDDGSPPELLSAITVFDRDCASVHVQKKNEVWFRPFGLDIPDDLAGVCQHLKSALSSEKSNLERQRNPIFQQPTWSASSSVGKVMSALKHDTDLTDLKAKPTFSNEQEARLVQLRADLAQDGSVASATYRQNATKLDQSVTYLRQVEQACSDDALGILKAKKEAAVSKRQAADLAATSAFSDSAIAGVGEAAWKALWDSARKYSRTVGNDGIDFPPTEGDFCPLCHQSVDETTAKRLSRFESFIQQDTEAAATEAEQALQDALSSLKDFDIHVKRVTASFGYLRTNDPPLARKILRLLAVSRSRQRQVIAQIGANKFEKLTPLPISPISELEAAANTARTYAASLVASDGDESRKKLTEELDELEDLKEVHNFISIAEAEVARLVIVERLDKCLAETSTTAITKLGNSIADDLITPLMRDRFRQEIGALAGNRVRVEIVRSGGKFGSPQYEVRLYANPKAKVHDVLSEGEQTCVALAAYLTELANASHNSALVFDDPVTSLDHRWRHNVAKRLVKEANDRQIIVFTHDLIFVNDLHQMAKDSSVPIGLSHLSRGEQGVGLVTEDLPWRASGVRDRIDKLEKEAREAKVLYDANADEDYRSAAHRVYDRLRAAWERALEDIVFAGVILRHRDYINTKGLGRVTALEESDVATFNAGFKKCCDYVEAHDASRGRDSDPPEPSEIMADIQTLNTWSTQLRSKMNAVS